MTNATKLLDRPLIERPVTAIRRTRRAYLGALGLSYDFAVARAEKRRTQVTALFGELVERGETIETDAKGLFERAKDEARELTGSAATAVKDAAEDIVEQAQAVQSELAETKTTDVDDRYAAHIAKVQAYDASADPVIVKRIVDHLGIALQSRDTKFVACSDESERKTVAESWLGKKLGVTGDAAEMDVHIMAVCETMKADRFKDRVTFYYLIAKNADKLAAL